MLELDEGQGHVERLVDQLQPTSGGFELGYWLNGG